MNQKYVFSCVMAALIAAQTGCSDQQSSDISSTESAISLRNFDTEGGEPWNRSQNVLLPSDYAGSTAFGRIIQTGDINADGKIDIISSFKTSSNTDRIDIYYGSSSNIFSLNTATEKTPDGFGHAAKVGKFCPALGAKGDILIASAPDYSNKAGAFGLIYRTTATKVQRRLNHSKAGDHAGQYFDIADIDGDKSPDLVYSTLNNDKASIVIAKNLCSQNGTIASNYTFELPGTYSTSDAGTIIKAAAFKDISDADTLVVASPATKEILFLALDGDKLIQTHPALKIDADIQSIELADMTKDGSHDLILGLKSKDQPGGFVTVLPNPGKDMAFNFAEALWTYQSESKSAELGYSIEAADLNEDGYMDLIIGAPGESDGHGKIYVAMGTADGTVLSKPYWRSTAKNSVMGLGSSIHAAKLNASSKGWLDILAGSPNGDGNVTVYYQDNRPCYTADKCLVDEICFNSGTLKDSCEICDPKLNNFEFVPLTCPESKNPCENEATCVPQKGCTYAPAPDDTLCSDAACTNNNLTVGQCKAGKCQIKTYACAAYVCHEDMMSCPNTCKVDADCSKGYVCQNSICKVSNHPPVIIVDDVVAEPGQRVTLNASKTYDPDNDPLAYHWVGPNSAMLNNPSIPAPFVTIPPNATNGTKYIFILVVTDNKGGVAQKTVTVTVQKKNADNHPPAVVINPNITGIPGSTILLDASQSFDPDNDPISFQWSGEYTSMLSDTTSEAPRFTIPSGAKPGTTYNFTLTVTDSHNAKVAQNVTVTVVQSEIGNHAPVATLPPKLYLPMYDQITVNAGQSYDPDHDPLTYFWKVTGPCVLSSDLGESIQIMPQEEHATPASQCNLYMTAIDIHGAQNTTSSLISIVDGLGDYSVEIYTPHNGEFTTSPVTFTGHSALAADTISIIDQHTGIMLCEAPFDFTWQCSANLAEGDYSVYALTLLTITTDPVSFHVGNHPDHGLVITNPHDGSYMASLHTTAEGEIYGSCDHVVVYATDISRNGDEFILCESSVTPSNKWACYNEIPLNTGTQYSMFAYCQDNNAGYRSNIVTFSTPGPFDPNDEIPDFPVCSSLTEPSCDSYGSVLVTCVDGKYVERKCYNGCSNGKCIEDPQPPTCNHKPQCTDDADAAVYCENDSEIVENCPYGCENGKCNSEPPACNHKPYCDEVKKAVVYCENDKEHVKNCLSGCENGKCIEDPFPVCNHKPYCSADKKAVIYCDKNEELTEECPYGCENGVCQDAPTYDCESSCFDSNHLLEVCSDGTEIEYYCEIGCDHNECISDPPIDIPPEGPSGDVGENVRGSAGCSQTSNSQGNLAWMLFAIPALALIRRRKVQ